MVAAVGAFKIRSEAQLGVFQSPVASELKRKKHIQSITKESTARLCPLCNVHHLCFYWTQECAMWAKSFSFRLYSALLDAIALGLNVCMVT